MSDITPRMRAELFVAQLMKDAAGPNTGSLEADMEAWPGCGISAEELVNRLEAAFSDAE